MDPLLIAIAVIVALAVCTLVLSLLSPRERADRTPGESMAARLESFRPDSGQPVTAKERIARLRQRSTAVCRSRAHSSLSSSLLEQWPCF
jgi:hypothetical protein